MTNHLLLSHFAYTEGNIQAENITLFQQFFKRDIFGPIRKLGAQLCP